MTDFEQHLRERGWSPYMTNIIVDWETEIATFYIWSGSKLVGYQRYNWKETSKKNNYGRYYTHLSDCYKATAFFAEHLYGLSPLFVVEGVWDCVRVQNCYVDCVAVLSNTPHRQLRWLLRQLSLTRPLICLQDNDGESGRKLNFGDYNFVTPRVKDPGEMCHEDCFDWITEILRKVNKC